MNRHSIRFRLTAWYAGILAVTFAAVGIGTWLAIRDGIDDTVDKDLRSRLQSMRPFLQQPVEALREDAAIGPAGARVRIANESGHWLYRSPGTESWTMQAPQASALPKRGRFETISERGKPVRVLSAFAPPFVVQIGEPLDEFREMLDAFTWTALLASPILLLLASAGGYWMSRRALEPVQRIARTAAEIGAHNLSERLPVRGAGDELDDLSRVLNAMLARLEDSFRRVTRFTADASHELRTPVAIVRTTAEVARRKPRTEEQYAEALDRILAESERITALLEDLMLLARADAGAPETAAQLVPLEGLAQSVCHDAQVLAGNAGIRLAADSLAPCAVSGDEPTLRRLMLILLDNAIKYSRPGGEVHVSVAPAKWNGRAAALIEVRDNGIGVAPDDLPHVFDRFYRASKDRSRKIDGVGLGLSIAQSIVQAHGGEIQLKSALGEGAAARVYLPLA